MYFSKKVMEELTSRAREFRASAGLGGGIARIFGTVCISIIGRAGERIALDGVFQSRKDGLFEKFVRENLDSVVAGRERCDSVLAEIEASLRHRKSRLPVGHEEIAVLVFIGFFAGGDKTQVLWPAEGEVIRSELRSDRPNGDTSSRGRSRRARNCHSFR